MVQPYQATLQITVTDNQFEDTLVQLIGEGYLEDVTIDNLHTLASSPSSTSSNPDDPESSDLLADEDLAALKSNSIHFGDCYINERKQLLFTIRNVSQTQCYRFEWPHTIGLPSSNNNTITSVNNQTMGAETSPVQNATSVIQFSPRVGHLHAGCAKDITVTFRSGEARMLRKELAQCVLSKIGFEQPINEVARFFFNLDFIFFKTITF
jgi:hydrocephalus-inducing protein